ncbi:MAG TPA: phytanoyl-CoA dioxygenase family protein, partial [Tabrizicola sp.]|nr:phytanoyl-CoA dioxygenase family protein [Tabrizicola sp.]
MDRSHDMQHRHRLRPEDCQLSDLQALCAMPTLAADYPLAQRVEKSVLIYDCPTLLPRLTDPGFADLLAAEWVEAFANGPGVIVLSGAEPDLAMLDQASAIFRDLIDRQNREGTGGGDHFAKPGANDRLWNSLEKHCPAGPANFARYYANPFLALVSKAWLGPFYQMTAQLNVVNPGGAAQSPHRDYHLGFQTAEAVAQYPTHVHRFSPMLTLQGAIAHVDATIEAGPPPPLPPSPKNPA